MNEKESIYLSARIVERYTKAIKKIFGDKEIIIDSTNKDELMPKTLKQAKKINKVMLLDPANVVAIRPNNEFTYQFMTRFICNIKDSYIKAGKLDYVVKQDEVCRTRFSLDYMNRIIQLGSVVGDSIIINMKKNYPATFEIRDEDKQFDFDIILARRVELEE